MIQQFSHIKLICLPLKQIGFNLFDDEDFTIPHVVDTIPNYKAGHQLPTQAKKNVWIVAINVEEPIISQGVNDELKCHQNPRRKPKVAISLCKKNSYQMTNIEFTCFIFYQVIHVVSYIEVSLPDEPLTPRTLVDI